MNIKTLGLLALTGALGMVLWKKHQSPFGASYALESDGQPGRPLGLQQGVRYLFVVRTIAPDEAVKAALADKGVEGLEFAEASVPPVWAKPGEHYSNRAAAFKKTLGGSSTVTLGDSFYGIGQLEKVARLDGLPFDAPPALSTSEEVDYFPWV